MAGCPQQSGIKDCGLFSMVTATALANSLNPNNIQFDQGKMRLHLIECFEKSHLETFP